MKYLKKYESIKNEEPQIGDYVLVNSDISYNSDKFEKFISNSIGIIVKINLSKSLLIKYKKIPANIKYVFRYRDTIKGSSNQTNNSILIGPNDILYYSKNKEDCEIYLAQQKYNL